MAGRNKFSLSGCIDAVKTGRDGWRTTDAEMNLCCSRSPNHFDNLTAGRSADKGIVDQNNTFASEEIGDWVQLDPHSEMSNRLFGLDKGATNVVIPNQSEFKLD